MQMQMHLHLHLTHTNPAFGKSEFFLFCECLQFFLRELERASGSYNPAAF